MIKNSRILIVDNNHEYRTTVVEYLLQKGCSVMEASNLADAQKILNTEIVDLAILDIRMVSDNDPNDISGLKLAIESTPEIPKIILTAYPRPDLVREASHRIGGKFPAASDFLDKGEGLEDLLSAIQKLLPIRDVFIVHGHDDTARLEVKDFLSRLHLNPIILKDLPNSGQFIMEKLEHASNNIFAIVLLTPDDECHITGKPEMEKRARQNVILEAGYFMAKLGRDRVCMLYKENVDLPSDIFGLLWIKMDKEGAWKISVARELRAAGISIDLNNVL